MVQSEPTTTATTTTTTTTTIETTTATTATTRNIGDGFEVSIDEILSVAGLSAEVHDFAQLQEHHLGGFEERLVVEDLHESPQLGRDSDHARVHTRSCSVASSGDEV